MFAPTSKPQKWRFWGWWGCNSDLVPPMKGAPRSGCASRFGAREIVLLYTLRSQWKKVVFSFFFLVFICFVIVYISDSFQVCPSFICSFIVLNVGMVELGLSPSRGFLAVGFCVAPRSFRGIFLRLFYANFDRKNIPL